MAELIPASPMPTILMTVVFFFSSRRRHTRLQGDWSSDVCSSDLVDPKPGATPIPWLKTPFAEGSPHVSPDGKWMAFTSDSGGQTQVYVAPFDNARSEERRVGKEGRSRWSPDHLKKKK